MKLFPQRRELPPMSRLQDQVNRLFDGFFTDDWPDASDEFVPALDVMDSPESFVVRLEIPGVDPKDVQVSVQDNVLTIAGEKKSEKKEEGRNWFRREASFGKFTRTMSLPATVDASRIEAVQDAGVLTLTLPKSNASKPHKIEIKARK